LVVVVPECVGWAGDECIVKAVLAHEVGHCVLVGYAVAALLLRVFGCLFAGYTLAALPLPIVLGGSPYHAVIVALVWFEMLLVYGVLSTLVAWLLEHEVDLFAAGVVGAGCVARALAYVALCLCVGGVAPGAPAPGARLLRLLVEGVVGARPRYWRVVRHLLYTSLYALLLPIDVFGGGGGVLVVTGRVSPPLAYRLWLLTRAGAVRSRSA